MNAAECYNRGIDLCEQRRFAEAEAAFRQALELCPEMIEAQCNLAALLQSGQGVEEAERLYRQVLRQIPDDPDAMNNLANLLSGQRRFAEANALLEQATLRHPDDGTLRNTLGVLLKNLGRFAAAEALFQQALERNPDSAEAHNNLGNLLQEQGRLTEAEAAYRHALSLEPDHVDAGWNLGLLHLSMGNFQAGWPLYELRTHPARDTRQVKPRPFPFPQWRGEDPGGKRVLVVAEQGFGDLLQFARLLPVMKRLGVGWITLLCHPLLLPLMTTLEGVDAVVAERRDQTCPEHDFWVFALSLPWRLGITLENLPNALPYLRAPREHASALPPGFRVGLAWRGNPAHQNDPHRSLPDLALLAPLWSVEGVVFVSLQKGVGEEEARHPPAGQPLLEMGATLHDFGDAAALLSRLDLVITIDSAMAHLAGALGKPCWVLLSARGTDWRWLRGRSDSPWYPGVMRLYRQTTPDDWGRVVAQVTGELAAHVRHQRGIEALRGGAVLAALPHLQAALEAAPHREQHWLDYLHALLRSGQPETAAQVLARGRGLGLAGEVVDGLERFCYTLLTMNTLFVRQCFPQLEQMARELLVHCPEDYWCHKALGLSLMEQGKKACAVAPLTRAVALLPEDVALTYNLGVLLMEQNALQEAEAVFRQLLDRQPDHREGGNNLGLILKRQQRFAD
ncbi:MAG: tetratricopeptide repeat protein, partial [Magnetococcales bacterium]|nr:tetratricopeptide repeat protein [Magnetococcales bacterium]